MEHLCFGGAFGFLRLHFFVKWLAGVGFGRCGLVAKVPQDRMLSRSDTRIGRDGKARFGER